MSYTQKKKRFLSLYRSWKNCERCELCKVRNNVVIGHGNMSSRFLIVGQNPGRTEDERGFPFVGSAGRILNDVLVYHGLTRDDFYITNAVACLTPDNRKPTEEEENKCRRRLERIYKIIKPVVVVCLGDTAMRACLPGYKESPVGVYKARGIYRRDGVGRFGKIKRWVCATIHPASLLYDDENGTKLEEFYGDWEKFADIILTMKEELY